MTVSPKRLGAQKHRWGKGERYTVVDPQCIWRKIKTNTKTVSTKDPLLFTRHARDRDVSALLWDERRTILTSSVFELDV